MGASTLVDALQGSASAALILAGECPIQTRHCNSATRSCRSGTVHRRAEQSTFAAGGGPTLSRSQLQQQVARFASVLKASGIRPGDTVSLADTNTVRVCHQNHDAAHVHVPNMLCMPDAQRASAQSWPMRWGMVAGRVCGCFLGHHLGPRRRCAPELQLQAGESRPVVLLETRRTIARPPQSRARSAAGAGCMQRQPPQGHI